MRPLTDAERQRVEENMGLVGWVIRDCVHQYSHGVYDYDDLMQIGYMGLCKAVLADKPGCGAFSTYAYIIIRNELYSALEYATRRGAELATDPAELPHEVSNEAMEQRLICRELLDRLEKVEASASGVTAKGFQAIRLMVQGYSSREIGEQFGVQANHVTAWVAKARKQLAVIS